MASVKTLSLVSLMALASLSLAACSQDPAEDKPSKQWSLLKKPDKWAMLQKKRWKRQASIFRILLSLQKLRQPVRQRRLR